MKKNLQCAIRYGVASTLLLLTGLPSAQSNTVITIGKGSGIVWEGLPFNEELSGPLETVYTYPRYGLSSISNLGNRCMEKRDVTTIAGYNVVPLTSTSHIGLIPRATTSVTYTTANGVLQQMQGTIGLPETIGTTSTNETITPTSNPWCLAPSMATLAGFYAPNGERTSNIAGSWVIVADGMQESQEITLSPMYFGSYSAAPAGDRTVQIFPTDITLRISTLECVVNTPLAVNFGFISRNTAANSELATIINPLMVDCTQDTNLISANVNVQFRAITGLYDAEPTRLALQQGGGYITGEISDVNATGSGACGGTGGVSFNSTPLTLGTITELQMEESFNNNITWRLCSGGADLPTGAVNASTEMLVTFN